MNPLGTYFRRITGRLQRERLQHEAAEELHAHRERLEADLRAEGRSPDEARTIAAQRIGNATRLREEEWNVWHLGALEDFVQDLRYGARFLRRTPVFTFVAVASLGLGIGANTAVFSLLDAVMFKSLPVHDPKNLVFVQRMSRAPDGKISPRAMPWPAFARLRAENTVMSQMAASTGVGNLSLTVNGAAERLPHGMLLVSGDFFATLGVVPYRGRLIGPEDDRVLGGHPVVVLTWDFWRSRFGGDESLIDKPITINGTPFTVIGIAPPKFFGLLVGDQPDGYVPLMMDSVIFRAPSSYRAAGNGFLTVLGRLKPGVTRAQAESQLTPMYIRARIETGGAVVNDLSLKAQEGTRIEVQDGAGGQAYMRDQFGRSLVILMTMVALVLLIACGNIANLLLGRAAARRREIAVRVSLGAGRERLMRQLLAESLLLGVAGGALGLGLAQWGNRLLIAVLSTNSVWPVIDLRPDGRVLAFTAIVAIGTGLLFGLAPAFGATKVDIGIALKDGARGTIGAPHARLGRALVVAQVALSLVLVAGMGLFARSLAAFRTADVGFARDHVLLVRFDPRRDGYTAERTTQFYRGLAERARHLAGVTDVALAAFTPMEGTRDARKLAVPGYTPMDGERMLVFVVPVSPEYFTTLRAQLSAGRVFDDPVAGAPASVVVNTTFTEHYLRDGGTLGRRITMSDMSPTGDAEVQVVGVVRDMRLDNLRDSILPTVFIPFSGAPAAGRANLILRTAADPAAVGADVRSLVRETDPKLELLSMRSLATQMEWTLQGPRIVARISTFFGSVALVLAALGLYGILSYSVTRRLRELGLRIALGASPGAVRRMVLRESGVLLAGGVAVGLPLALLLGRLVRDFLFGLNAADPVVLGASVLALGVTAAVAGYWPARRASKVDPLTTLRAD